ncbi:alpha/beta fold hydrolase [Deinococcus sp.]|uniref:alpha/beta fold hydrolase n=1 Tax=Deinococcus sp. TaxID=47478 RepID=UPI003C7BE85B
MGGLRRARRDRPHPLRRLPHKTLLLRGIQDSFVLYSTSLHLAGQLPGARAHLLGRYSHWTQIEYVAEFHRLEHLS